MQLFGHILICALLGYCIGGLNPAYLLAKKNGFDIRGTGSGNAGASNATITMGKKVGAFCALFDIFKAFLTVKVSMKLYPLWKLAGIIAGTCCILGHIFPLMMHFQGGKGLAAFGGLLLAYDARLFLLVLLLEAVIVLVTDYICVVTTSASCLFLLYLLFHGLAAAVTFFPAVCAIFMKHKENFRRIRYGVEARFSYLWNKAEEVKRIQENWDRLTDEERSMLGPISV